MAAHTLASRDEGLAARLELDRALPDHNERDLAWFDRHDEYPATPYGPS